MYISNTTKSNTRNDDMYIYIYIYISLGTPESEYWAVIVSSSHLESRYRALVSLVLFQTNVSCLVGGVTRFFRAVSDHWQQPLAPVRGNHLSNTTCLM